MIKLSNSTQYWNQNGDPQVRILLPKEDKKIFSGVGFPQLTKPLIFEKNPNIKLTDCLSLLGFDSRGFLIHKNVKLIFEKYKFMDHHYYSTIIVDTEGNKISTDYLWIRFSEDLIYEIDFYQSKFYEMNLATKLNEIEFTSYDAYGEILKTKDWKWGITPKKIALKSDSKLKSYDLFCLNWLTSDIFISEKLSETIIKEKLTGFLISESDKLFFVN